MNGAARRSTLHRCVHADRKERVVAVDESADGSVQIAVVPNAATFLAARAFSPHLSVIDVLADLVAELVEKESRDGEGDDR
jgi:hypothetical protein